MTKKTQYYPLGGGLDITTAAIVARPGTARAALNYESDIVGFRRVGGFERFDGRTSPTDAYAAANNIPQAEIDRDAARAAITEVPGDGPIRGVWFYNGQTYAFRDKVPVEKLAWGTFAGGVPVGFTTPAFTAATITGGRLRLTAVGSVGNIAGYIDIPVESGREYTFTVDAYAGTGAQPVFFLGTPATPTLYHYTGAITPDGTRSHTFTATNGTLRISLGGTSFTDTHYVEFDNASLIASDPENCSMYVATPSGWSLVSDVFTAGGQFEFVNYNFTGSASNVKMYGVNGVDKAFQYDGSTVTFITTGMTTDVPIKIEAHKRHLFLAFGGGSLQHSALGDPLTWTAVTGAAELALGDEITNLVSAAPSNLVVIARNSVSLLYGSDASDWQLETLTNEAGGLANTAEKLGPVIYMDNRGLRNLTTTPAFGNFNIGTMTLLVSPIIRTKLASGNVPAASCRVRSRDLYRVFFDDGTGLSVYIGKKNPEVMPIDLGIPVRCICSAETENGSERIWFGSDNGFVYEMDKGRSFDGEAVSYHVRLPFNHMGGPQLLKRWHKAIVEYDAADSVTIRLAGEVDYADPDEPGLAEQNIVASGGGGFWNSVNWDQFNWSAPVEGSLDIYIDAIGQSLSLIMGGSNADEEPHTLQGITLTYSVRGVER